MHLVGKNIIQRLIAEQPTAHGWASAWTHEVAHAQWKSPSDVHAQYPRARERAAGKFAFPVAGTTMDVLLALHFAGGIAVIENLIERDESDGP